jgi:16S rRNA (cytosine1407-C5)-methyltransferase
MSKQLIEPTQIEAQLRAILAASRAGDEKIQQSLASFARSKHTALRINTLKISVEAAHAELAKSNLELNPVAWSPWSFTLAEHSGLSRLPISTSGGVYIQNLSSQLTVKVLDPKPGSYILDLAAAPGGKTSLIAQYQHNDGKISAVEPVKDRYYRLIANLGNLGVTNTRCYWKDGRSVGKVCQEWFDQVLLDAPCSSMAQIDLRIPASYAHWNLKKVKECARKQKQLIVSAFNSLKPGGSMVYSTCSWMVEENEEVVNHLLTSFPNSAQLISIAVPIVNFFPGLTSYQGKDYHPSLVNSLRIAPNEQFEAFYLAKIVKCGEQHAS